MPSVVRLRSRTIMPWRHLVDDPRIGFTPGRLNHRTVLLQIADELRLFVATCTLKAVRIPLLEGHPGWPQSSTSAAELS